MVSKLEAPEKEYVKTKAWHNHGALLQSKLQRAYESHISDRMLENLEKLQKTSKNIQFSMCDVFEVRTTFEID